MSADEDAEIARERQWLLSGLRQIPPDRAQLDEREQLLVRNARIAGIEWDDIGQALGVSADQAKADHGEPPAGAEPF